MQPPKSLKLMIATSMRVGIFLSNTLPEEGGAFTFESNLIYSLLELASELPHDFVIYGWDQDRSCIRCQRPNNVEFRSLDTLLFDALKKKPYYVLLGALSKLSHLTHLSQRDDSFFYTKWKEDLLFHALQADQIEIVWYPAPQRLIRDIPYIMTVWDLQHRLQPFFPEVSVSGEWIKRERYYQTVLKRASFVVTGTKTGKAEIERFYHVPETRIQVLPLPTPSFAPSSAEEIDTSILKTHHLSPGYLFYPAQFWAHKNHVNLLLALQLLRNQYNLSLTLVLVGSDKGNQEYIQQQVVELGLSNQVKFLGFVSQIDLITLYQNALVLTFVSFFGPDNLPPLEAFALGCPVIVADVPGAEEQLGDAVLRVSPQSPEQIAVAVKQLYDNQSMRQALVKRGYERSKCWTRHDYVRKISDLISQFSVIRRCWQN